MLISCEEVRKAEIKRVNDIFVRGKKSAEF